MLLMIFDISFPKSTIYKTKCLRLKKMLSFKAALEAKLLSTIVVDFNPILISLGFFLHTNAGVAFIMCWFGILLSQDGLHGLQRCKQFQ